MDSAAGPGEGPSILVIKLSALGDMIMASGAFAAIRRAHPDAHIRLLTSPGFRWLGESCGSFDEVWTTEKPAWWRPWEAWALARRLRGAGFARVYDLQWSSLSNRLFRALRAGGLEWVGVAPGCSHFYPDRKARKHITARHAEMLRLAGIEALPPSDFGFLEAEIEQPLPTRFALVVPGSSARHPEKRWPLPHYIALCQALTARGLEPVLICGPDERGLADEILQACPSAHHFATPLPAIAELARRAQVAIGNDTGPLHLIAAVGCPTVALFRPEGQPEKTGPLGTTRCLQAESFEALSVERVLAAALALCRDAAPGVRESG